jgi:hypothetical protein
MEHHGRVSRLDASSMQPHGDALSPLLLPPFHPSYVIFRPAWLERADGLKAGKEGQYGSGSSCDWPLVGPQASRQRQD